MEIINGCVHKKAKGILLKTIEEKIESFGEEPNPKNQIKVAILGQMVEDIENMKDCGSVKVEPKRRVKRT